MGSYRHIVGAGKIGRLLTLTQLGKENPTTSVGVGDAVGTACRLSSCNGPTWSPPWLPVCVSGHSPSPERSDHSTSPRPPPRRLRYSGPPRPEIATAMRQWSLLLKEEGFHLVQETLQVAQGVICVIRRGLVLIGVAVQGVSHLVPAGGWTQTVRRPGNPRISDDPQQPHANRPRTPSKPRTNLAARRAGDLTKTAALARRNPVRCTGHRPPFYDESRNYTRPTHG